MQMEPGGPLLGSLVQLHLGSMIHGSAVEVSAQVQAELEQAEARASFGAYCWSSPVLAAGKWTW